MAYEPTVWENGDVITAEKMNKIENGIVNSVLIVHEVNGSLDKTWQEINNAGFSILQNNNGINTCAMCQFNEESNLYEVVYWNSLIAESISYNSSSPSELPHIDTGIS